MREGPEKNGLHARASRPKPISGPLLDHLRLASISGKSALNPSNLAHK